MNSSGTLDSVTVSSDGILHDYFSDIAERLSAISDTQSLAASASDTGLQGISDKLDILILLLGQVKFVLLFSLSAAAGLGVCYLLWCALRRFF